MSAAKLSKVMSVVSFCTSAPYIISGIRMLMLLAVLLFLSQLCKTAFFFLGQVFLAVSLFQLLALFVLFVGQPLAVDVNLPGLRLGFGRSYGIIKLLKIFERVFVEFGKCNVVVEVVVLETIINHALDIDAFELLQHTWHVVWLHPAALDADNGAEIEEVAHCLAVAF